MGTALHRHPRARPRPTCATHQFPAVRDASPGRRTRAWVCSVPTAAGPSRPTRAWSINCWPNGSPTRPCRREHWQSRSDQELALAARADLAAGVQRVRSQLDRLLVRLRLERRMGLVSHRRRRRPEAAPRVAPKTALVARGQCRLVAGRRDPEQLANPRPRPRPRSDGAARRCTAISRRGQCRCGRPACNRSGSIRPRTSGPAITGSPLATRGAFRANPVWIAGFDNHADAAQGCGFRSFTGGPVLMTQYLHQDGFDANVRCAYGRRGSSGRESSFRGYLRRRNGLPTPGSQRGAASQSRMPRHDELRAAHDASPTRTRSWIRGVELRHQASSTPPTATAAKRVRARPRRSFGTWFAAGGGRRDKVVLVTKVFGPMTDWPNDGLLSARSHHPVVRGKPHADADRLHRSVPDAPHRSRRPAVGRSVGKHSRPSSHKARSSTRAAATSRAGTSSRRTKRRRPATSSDS